MPLVEPVINAIFPDKNFSDMDDPIHGDVVG
jgi:hypothetical protein